MTQAFHSEDRAADLRDLDLSKDTIPVLWDIASDSFTFKLSEEKKPFTKRGMLSIINSLYDPLGLAAPVVIRGKMLLRSMMETSSKPHPESWDEPLPEGQRPGWENWCQTLQGLTLLRVPRCYTSVSLKAVSHRELYTFCDTSNKAIGAIYLRTIHCYGEIQVAFVLGKAKLAPSHATTVPRLELCAAVLAVEIAELITEEMDLEFETTAFHSDSRVVLHKQRKPPFLCLH